MKRKNFPGRKRKRQWRAMRLAYESALSARKSNDAAVSALAYTLELFHLRSSRIDNPSLPN